MISLNIILTTFCDWSCSYCNVTTCGKHWLTREKVDKHLPYLKGMIEDYELVLSGGEIGYVDRDVLIYLLEQLDRPVIINTNGIFMEAGLHQEPRIRKYISRILYHVVDEPSDKEVQVYTDDELDISYGVVGYDPDEMAKFLKRNNHIEFDYVSYDTPFGIVDVDYVKLMLNIRELSNVSDKAIEILEAQSVKHNNVTRYRKVCRATNFTIDLSSEEICLCAFRNKHINMPLTRENMIQVLTNHHTFIGDDTCESCHRVCLDVNMEKIIKGFIKNRDKYGQT